MSVSDGLNGVFVIEKINYKMFIAILLIVGMVFTVLAVVINGGF